MEQRNGDLPIMRFYPTAKRVRAWFGGRPVVDSTRSVLLLERGHWPVFYFPRSDVPAELLSRSNHRTHCPHKGDASYWSLEVNGRRAENAVWSYEDPLESFTDLAGYLAFAWDDMEAWYEEDVEILGHARDPFHRVDILPSARKVAAVLDGDVIAESDKALFVYETGIRPRYYFPQSDVKTERLIESRHHTNCPYKGRARYWSLRRAGEPLENAVWSYPTPYLEAAALAGTLAFYDERLDALLIDGEAS
jgi:uncharacterized protein (DUF427 family)